MDWRTKTFAWINHHLPTSTALKINDQEFIINGDKNDNISPITMEKEEIKNIVYYHWFNETNDEYRTMEFIAAQEKSESLRVKTTIINPTQYSIKLVRLNFKCSFLRSFLRTKN